MVKEDTVSRSHSEPAVNGPFTRIAQFMILLISSLSNI